ncbi:hypothetical protein ACFL2Q_19665 [Thermodesulfobacteriota bacterium]
MKELFEQTTKFMEQTWDQWQQAIQKAPWMGDQEGSFAGKWGSWIATTRSACDTNMNLWKTFMEQSEENFFKMWKQSPLWNESVESQMRELWDGLKKAQDSQQDFVKSQLEKMEELMQPKE